MTDSTRKARIRRIVLLGLLGLAVAVTADFFLYPRFPTSAPARNTGHNGLWLRYTWYLKEKTDAQWAALAKRLHEGQIRYAFCHVRSIAPDGRLRYRDRERARALVRRLHRLAPDTRAIAWIYAENKPGDYWVDVADPAIRARMVQEAVWLVTACGFDGVQWDYEVIRNGDPLLPALLCETRAALPAGAFLSVCTPPWYPGAATRVYGWDEAYFAEVARHCDQVAIMGYDTGMPLPRSYAWLMAQQAIRVPRALLRGNAGCRVLFGVPTYDAVTKSHYPAVENLSVALKGLRDGLRDPRTVRSACDGVALFAEYTTSDEEWQIYRQLWPASAGMP